MEDGAMNWNCVTCETKLLRSEKRDAYYCWKCDRWTERDCRDSSCDFCTKRPERPSFEFSVVSYNNKKLLVPREIYDDENPCLSEKDLLWISENVEDLKEYDPSDNLPPNIVLGEN